LKDLLPVGSPEVNAETKTVVTIPEDLALTDEEKEVLGNSILYQLLDILIRPLLYKTWMNSIAESNCMLPLMIQTKLSLVVQKRTSFAVSQVQAKIFLLGSPTGNSHLIINLFKTMSL
jgi:hypothetical protein